MARKPSNTFHLRNLGPIGDVSLDLGDLTLLVGPQGTGKSIALQLFKLALDRLAIAKTARDNGLVWKSARDFLDVYLGSGLGRSLTQGYEIVWKGKPVALPPQNRNEPGSPQVFYIPAQRSLTVADGWPRAFSSYSAAPFVVREFGLTLQELLLGGPGETLFPASNRLKAGLRNAVNESVFHSGSLQLRVQSHQREMKLVHGKAELPYMAWSAGQREFAPLLLALYKLLPAAAKAKDGHVDWVIIEEPEMGLHPQAILATMSLVMDLLHRGYQVMLSTHHPLVLDVVWLIRELQANKGKPQDLLKAIDLPRRQDLVKMAESVLQRSCRVFEFRHGDGGVVSTDISSLDPFAEDEATAGWGGLTGHSARVQDVVSAVVSQGGAE